MIKTLFNNRIFIWSLVKQELKGRYTASVIGFSWTIINPMLTIIIFVIVFSEMMQLGIRNSGGSNTKDYIIYITIGIISWNALSEAVIRSTDIFIEYSVIIKRVLFPKEILIAQVLFATTINLLIGIFILVFLMIFMGYPVHIRMILLFFPVVIQISLTLGLALILSTLNVFFRDVSTLVRLCLNIWFWLSPVVYSVQIIPPEYRVLTKFNPMTHLLSLYRSLIFNLPLPGMRDLAVVSITSIILLLSGKYLFKKFEKDFSDEV